MQQKYVLLKTALNLFIVQILIPNMAKMSSRINHINMCACQNCCGTIACEKCGSKSTILRMKAVRPHEYVCRDCGFTGKARSRKIQLVPTKIQGKKKQLTRYVLTTNVA